MLLSTFSLALLACSTATPLQPRWDDTFVKHSWVDTPRGWTYHSSPSPNHQFDLRIGLTQPRISELIDHLTAVSDPHHTRYGQHLSKDETEALVAAQPGSSESVEEWLDFHGIDPSRVSHLKAGGDWLTLRVSVAEAERLLDTKYHVYYHETSGDKVVRALGYSVPKQLHSRIDVITPTTYFSTLRSMRSTSFLQPDIDPAADVESLAGLVLDVTGSKRITPASLRELYNTTNYVARASSKNLLGVAGYLGEYANNADLQTFLKQYRPDAVGTTFSTTQVNGGGNDQTQPGVEASLDIQYTIGMSYPTPNMYYSTGGSPPFQKDSQTTTNTNEPYLDWVTLVLSQTTIPQVITTSYGDDEQTVPEDYAIRVCNLFAQIGARGTTLFFSSGDFGVGGGDCKTNDGTNKVLFQPAFPASCPYVTAVGGTEKINPEVGINFSGGGFSRYFGQPAYQAGAVSGFLARVGSQNAGYYNQSGRAYPDLSAQSSGYQVVVGGRVISVGGTSASSPTVAGIFALLNDYRLSLGLSSLGFINPLIYSTASSGFTDIISGSNPGCGTNGFSASSGWDPVTGLGTPVFTKLQSLVSSH